MLLLITLLFCSANADINNFVGTWLPGLIFPKEMAPDCDKIVISLDDSTKCSCVGATVPVVAFRNTEIDLPDDAIPKLPVMIVDSVSEVPKALAKRCECNGEYQQQLVFKWVNANYFLQYEQHYGQGYTEDMDYSGKLLAKILPKTVEELRAVYESLDDSRNKKVYVTCPKMFSTE